IVAPPDVVLRLSLLSGGAGLAFPDMRPNGGTIQGVPAIATDGAPHGTLGLIDAPGLAVDPGEIAIPQASHASRDLDGGGATLTNLWQSNLRGLRAERIFAASLARDGAVATITAASYGAAS